MHALRSAAALQTAALQQSATTAATVTLKVALWLKALHRSSHTALQPCSTAAQHPGKPAILQHSSRAAQEPSDSIATQRSMLRLPYADLPVYWRLQASKTTLLIWARRLSLFGCPYG